LGEISVEIVYLKINFFNKKPGVLGGIPLFLGHCPVGQLGGLYNIRRSFLKLSAH